MIDVTRRVGENDQTDEPGVSPTGPGGGHVPVRQRLNGAELAALIADRRAGMTIPQLVDRYGISRSSVKRVLRRHRGQAEAC